MLCIYVMFWDGGFPFVFYRLLGAMPQISQVKNMQ